MRKIFTLLIVAILATATSWAATTGTIKFGTNDVKIDKASVTAADDQGNSWEITTDGTEYFGQQSQYTQVGSASAHATSITFTTKLSKEVKVSSLSAKFGGFKGTAGTIKLSVGSTEVGTGNLSATKDVTVTSTSGASGTQLTVTVTNIAKGVKCYNITYTYEDSPEPQKTPTTLSFGEGVDGQTFTKYIGEKGFTYTATLSPVVEGATIDYSSTDENVAFVLDGEVELQKKEGVATIKASYAGNDTYEKSEASYTIDLKKLPISFSIPSGTAVVAGTKVTLSTIEGATLMYQIDGGDPVDVNSNTTDITIEKGCTIEAVASYNGANEGAQATYSIKEVKTITSFEISGTPSKTNYYVGEAFDYSGLKASATFSDNTTEDVTANATWTLNPASFTDATQNEVTVTATYEGATDTKTYPVTVTSIENTKETAYTVAEAIKLIDNGKTDVRVYVKGIVSNIVTPYSTKYKNITFNVSDDGATTTPQFQFFRNQKDAENTYAEDPKIEVGATVIGYGILKKFNDTYEFDQGNYLVEYTAPAAKTLTSIAITGEPAKVAYETGESFNPEGLTVTATYDDASTADVTADATWTFDPATFTVVGENIEVAVKAMYKEMEATTTATVSVAKAPLKYSIDLTKDETTTATAEKIEWAKDVVTVSGVQAKGGTAANNYYPGTVGKTYTSTRFYKNSTLTFAPKAGITILSVVYEAASENYANEMGSSTWTNATVKVEGEKVVITPTDGTTTFSAKIGGTTGGKSFTILYEGTSTSTLAELAENGEEGKEYTVNDEMVVAKKFQKGDKNYIVVKDAAQAVRNVSAPTDDDKFFNINGNKQEKYAQNNWMLVSLPVELYNQVNEKSTVTSITGSLTEKFNVAMEATKVVFENATNNFAPNTYCPINFMGESSVKGNNSTSSYYFATPKANEYANVVWAVYNSNDGAFYLPSNNGSINVQEFKAAFNVDYSLNSVDNPTLKDGEVYSFEALVKEVAVATTDAKSAPRKTAYDSTVAPSTKFVVYPLDLDDKKVATGVNDVNSAKEVKGVSYFNMMGVESAQPFDGVNIMVTTYTDGTQSAAKVLR
ncbi:MAG: bacterial Ig-like domain-containing protein [Bacteroidales bacterium]|nr:bacterial Ig-like domain-containing protein [Bacteroidales bacterium]MCI7031807.1 bacterial Ig-like domain-containing protein [Bacteroidales bacterium]